MRGLPLALLTLSVLVAAVPAQGALTLDSVQAPAGLLDPSGPAGRLTVEGRVDCRDLVPSGGAVQFELRAPAFLVLSGRSSVAVPACSLPEGSQPFVAEFDIAATRDAPGLLAIPLQVEAYFAPQGPYLPPLFGAAGDAEAQAIVVVAPDLRVVARSDDPVARCDCESVTVDIDVVNHGNVRTLHKVSVEAAPDGTHPQLPDPFILESRMGGGPSNATVQAHLPVPASGQAAYQVRITPVAADDVSYQGEAVILSFLVQRGGDAQLEEHAADVADIPAPTPLLALAALGAALLAARRRA